jgi:phosphoenolpyruvate synthase/pyruvate phosphate dikinase
MTNKRLEKLEEIVKGKRVLILVHNNPDPDAIAAGWALSYLLKKKFNMCEIPSNVILADQFARRFDGFSIGVMTLHSLYWMWIVTQPSLLLSLMKEMKQLRK